MPFTKSVQMKTNFSFEKNYLDFCGRFVLRHFNEIAASKLSSEIEAADYERILRSIPFDRLIETPVTDTVIQMDHKTAKVCKQILTSLKRDQNSSAFLQPVDPVTLGIPTYFDVIKFPMDLGTVTSKLEANQYSTVQQWISDIDLIFDNARIFNQPKSWVYEAATQMIKLFDKKLKATPGFAKLPPKEKRTNPSSGQMAIYDFDARKQIGERLNDLDNCQLLQALEIMLQDSRRVIAKEDVETINIDLSELSDQTIKKLEGFIKICAEGPVKKFKKEE